MTAALDQNPSEGNSPLADKALDALTDSDRLHHTARAQRRRRRRMLIQADHWHPARPITISVSLTTRPKIVWLVSEEEPLKDLAGSVLAAASMPESQL